jgi:formate dehydrogenase subunit gamma
LFAGASHNSRLSAVAPVGGSTEVRARVAELIAGLVPDNVDLLKALHRIQHEITYIPREAIPLLAAQFETTPALIFGTIDFYSELRQAPPAENVVEWCSGPACLLKGSAAMRRALEATLGCAMNQQSADGRLELRLVQCDGTCHLAPLIRYRGRYLGPLSTSEAITFARGLVPAKAAGPSVRQGGSGRAEAEAATPEPGE